MKFTFRGWGREVYPHNHKALPIRTDALTGRYMSGEESKPITWTSPTEALARLNNLSLTGDFLVEMTFSQNELKNWIRRCIQVDAKETLKLLAELQSEAIIEIATKAGKSSRS